MEEFIENYREFIDWITDKSEESPDYKAVYDKIVELGLDSCF